MKKYTSEEIKNRLSNIGEAIGTIALEYISELEQENEQLKAQNEKMKCCGNCKNLKYYEQALDKYECNIYDVSDISGVCDCDEWELAE